MWLDRPLARRPPLWWELPLGLIVFLGTLKLSELSFHDPQAAAQHHAAQVLGVEQAINVDVEHTFNAWLVAHDWLAAIVNYTYAADYLVTSVAVLVFLYLRRPATYRWARNSCVALNLVAVTCFALYPLSPPRLAPQLHIVDTVGLHHTWGSWGSPISNGANQLAAMPSLHFALALWVAVMLYLANASLVLRVLGIANAVLTFLVILLTGNHYVLDALGASVVVAVCVIATAPRHPRFRPDRFYAGPRNPSAPQLAGIVLMPGTDEETAETTVRRAIERGDPRWRQLLHRPSWRRPPEWTPADEPDWSWHIVRLAPADHDGLHATLRRVVARVASEPLPPDRPRWRSWIVPAANRAGTAVIVVVDRALDWRGWLDATLRSTAVVEDGFRVLDRLLERLRARQPGDLPEVATEGEPNSSS
jgi:hypothetical protein